MAVTDQEIVRTLEECVDAKSLKRVVAGLCEVCQEKADHIRSNWQDEDLARVWAKAGKLLDALSAKLDV